MNGINHLIECQCILPQYKKRNNPPFHRFVVFSIVDDSDDVVEKFSQCNNCGIVHRVYDICKSEIASGHESLNSLPSKDDFKLMLPSSVTDILNSYDCDLYKWEHITFILNQDRVGDRIILSKDEIGGKVQGKFLTYNGNSKFTIEPFLNDSEISNG